MTNYCQIHIPNGGFGNTGVFIAVYPSQWPFLIGLAEHNPGTILGMSLANDRGRYYAMLSLIGPTRR